MSLEQRPDYSAIGSQRGAVGGGGEAAKPQPNRIREPPFTNDCCRATVQG